MKLIFDQNLSHRLIPLLEDLFPGSTHVRSLGLHESSDLIVWEHARKNDLVIVTQDSDFADWNKIKGAPPKIIWLRCGNATVAEIHSKLRNASDRIGLLVASNHEQLEVLEVW